ncbi:MAG: RNA 2',3'-cyclic phosphodiesterase [Gammaproteobacteria bacterium]|nr:RNA 2',3'-cyclic phosphodiesterase [Gammaproteobacteria bacterium]
MSRLFFALWPDEASRSLLAEVAEKLPAGLGKHVPVQKLHLTLVFLGQVDDTVRDGLIEDANAIAVPPFAIEFTHSGWWPRAEVAWLAPDHIPAELPPLVQRLQDLPWARQIEVDRRPYAPHLTVARKVRRRPPALPFQPIRWEIREFCLVESTTGQAGSEYRILRRWALKS